MAKSVSDPFLRVCAAAVLAGKECPEPEDCIFLDAADSGAIILIDAPYELKENIKMLSERGWDAERKKWWVPIHGFNELMDEFPAAHPSAILKTLVSRNDEQKDVLATINKDAGEGAPIDVGDGLQLYPYQATAISFLDAVEGKGLITDEMGLGKTVEALAWLRAHPANRPVLVVCPATMKGTWVKEIAKWLNVTDPIVLKSKDTYAFDPTRGVVVINYDIMDAWKESLLHHRYNTIIIDESHYIKSEKAKRSKAVVAIAHRCKHRILLTGTPVISRPIELFNQLHAADPITWSSFFNFGKKYCGAHQEWVTNKKQIWVFDGATNIDELSERLKSTIMLRRTKAQVLPDLPDKSRQVIDVEIDNRKAYTKLMSKILSDDSYPGAPIVAFTELLMTMMRGKIKPSIRYIDDVLQDVDKLVVFCTHTEMINALEEKFLDRGVVKIDGSVAVHKRTDLIDQFQTDPETHLFMGNVQAAGIGITLTAASHAVFTELPWSPMELEQAEDRLHRISQENAVNIYVLNALNTVDAHITDLIVHKKQIINMINNDMTMDDLREFTQGGDPWAI
jgi:SWI/SNF-related matrix-associated actin-dependent regulator 1 of chromatin subfamily A